MFNILNSKYIYTLNEWHDCVNKQALLIYGPCGSGKSFLANEYLNYKKYSVFNYSILETKNKKSLINLLKDIMKSSMITSYFNNEEKQYGSIIIDDIDFTLIQKHEIIELLEFKKCNPQYMNKIILITNNKYNLSSLKKYLYFINITKPTYNELHTVAENLLNTQSETNYTIDYIINTSEYDYRKLIYLCNTIDDDLSIYKNKDNFDDIYDYTDNLYNNYISIKNTTNYNENFLIFNMLYENTFNNIINNTSNNNIEKINILNNIYNTYNFMYTIKNNEYNNKSDNYITYYGNKNISYNYNKLTKIVGKTNELNYPKNISIYNNRNLFIKSKLTFQMFSIFYKLNLKIYNLFIEYLISHKKNKEIISNYYKNIEINNINTLQRYSIIYKKK
jgi:hypothetical protein